MQSNPERIPWFEFFETPADRAYTSGHLTDAVGRYIGSDKQRGDEQSAVLRFADQAGAFDREQSVVGEVSPLRARRMSASLGLFLPRVSVSTDNSRFQCRFTMRPISPPEISNRF